MFEALHDLNSPLFLFFISTCLDRMTKYDVKNYLEKIYNVPVGEIRTRIQFGECHCFAQALTESFKIYRTWSGCFHTDTRVDALPLFGFTGVDSDWGFVIGSDQTSQVIIKSKN